MFLAVVFTIANTWKQVKSPSREVQGIEKILYTQTMEIHSAIKKNKLMPFATTWMDLENDILSKVSQEDSNKNMILLICDS